MGTHIGRRHFMLETHQPRPVNGMITLPDRPGFGIEFDESKIKDLKVVHWTQS